MAYTDCRMNREGNIVKEDFISNDSPLHPDKFLSLNEVRTKFGFDDAKTALRKIDNAKIELYLMVEPDELNVGYGSGELPDDEIYNLAQKELVTASKNDYSVRVRRFTLLEYYPISTRINQKKSLVKAFLKHGQLTKETTGISSVRLKGLSVNGKSWKSINLHVNFSTKEFTLDDVFINRADTKFINQNAVANNNAYISVNRAAEKSNMTEGEILQRTQDVFLKVDAENVHIHRKPEAFEIVDIKNWDEIDVSELTQSILVNKNGKLFYLDFLTRIVDSLNFEPTQTEKEKILAVTKGFRSPHVSNPKDHGINKISLQAPKYKSVLKKLERFKTKIDENDLKRFLYYRFRGHDFGSFIADDCYLARLNDKWKLHPNCKEIYIKLLTSKDKKLTYNALVKYGETPDGEKGEWNIYFEIPKELESNEIEYIFTPIVGDKYYSIEHFYILDTDLDTDFKKNELGEFIPISQAATELNCSHREILKNALNERLCVYVSTGKLNFDTVEYKTGLVNSTVKNELSLKSGSYEVFVDQFNRLCDKSKLALKAGSDEAVIDESAVLCSKALPNLTDTDFKCLREETYYKISQSQRTGYLKLRKQEIKKFLDNSQSPVNTFIFEPPIFTEKDLIGLGVENYNPQKHEYGQNVFEARKIVGDKIGITVSEDDFTDFEKEQRLYYINGVPYEAFAMVVKVNGKPVKTNDISIMMSDLFIANQDLEKLKGAAGASKHRETKRQNGFEKELMEEGMNSKIKKGVFARQGAKGKKKKEEEDWQHILILAEKLYLNGISARELARRTFGQLRINKLENPSKSEKAFINTLRKKFPAQEWFKKS